jgi:hypothetical protein
LRQRSSSLARGQRKNGEAQCVLAGAEGVLHGFLLDGNSKVAPLYRRALSARTKKNSDALQELEVIPL